MLIRSIIVVISITYSTSALSQAGYEVQLNTLSSTTPLPSSPAPTSMAPGAERGTGGILPTSTPVMLNSLEEITSNGLEVGRKVRFSVAEDVLDRNNTVVIPRGSPATGTVTWKTGKAIGGKSGKFEVTFDSLLVDGKSLQLMGKHRQEGKGNTVGALFGSIWISGRSAVMLPGQMVQALTAEALAY